MECECINICCIDNRNKKETETYKSVALEAVCLLEV